MSAGVGWLSSNEAHLRRGRFGSDYCGPEIGEGLPSLFSKYQS